MQLISACQRGRYCVGGSPLILSCSCAHAAICVRKSWKMSSMRPLVSIEQCVMRGSHRLNLRLAAICAACPLVLAAPLM